MITKTYEELMSEINLMTIEEVLKNAEKCLEPFEARDIIKQQQETINHQKAEIERLQTAKSFECNVTKFFDRYKTHIKAEAVKEVIETMKPWYRFLCVDKGDWYEQLDTHAYNLVKEMVGENK